MLCCVVLCCVVLCCVVLCCVMCYAIPQMSAAATQGRVVSRGLGLTSVVMRPMCSSVSILHVSPQSSDVTSGTTSQKKQYVFNLSASNYSQRFIYTITNAAFAESHTHGPATIKQTPGGHTSHQEPGFT